MRLSTLCLVAVLAVQLGCVPRQAGRIPDTPSGPDDNSDAVEYEPIPGNLFPGFEHAALIVDYYYSSGISLGDRYNYEIIVTDRVLRLAFHSPGTETYKRVDYTRTRELTASQASELRRVIRRAHLVQLRQAIPRPTFSGHTREVLIVREGALSVAGGRFNSNVFGEITQRQMEQQIAREHARTATIGGNFDSVVRAVEKLFTELPDLLSQMSARH